MGFPMTGETPSPGEFMTDGDSSGVLVEFTAQELRNILSGIDRTSEELEVLNTSYPLYLKRDLSNKTFYVYGDKETTSVDPLYVLRAEHDGEFGFVNRYFMLRSGEFDFDADDDPTDVPGVGGNHPPGNDS